MPSSRSPFSSKKWSQAVGPLSDIEGYKAHPVETQVNLLKYLTSKAATTEWGNRFGFEDIARASDPISLYQERVPVHSYEAFRSDVERIRKGEKDVIWPGVFQHFAVSSGTASAGKIIPLSEEMLNKNRRFTLAVALSYYQAKSSAAFFRGRLLSIPGRIEEDPAFPGTWVGEVSGLQFLFAPWAVRKFYQAVPRDILFLPNWETKLDAIVEHTLDMDVRAIAMVPSWGVVLFKKLMALHEQKTGKTVASVREIWPNLSVFFSGGVALSSYRDLLTHQVGGGMDFVENYGASEGYISFQDTPNADDMLVHLDNGVFLEFEPVDGSGPRIPISAVETGVRYRIFVSTCSGLWCYEVGDVVKFTSTHPYRLVVAGRTNEMLDKYGEAVYGDEARAALHEACAKTNAKVANFHIAPVLATTDTLPGHQWLIEFEVPPSNMVDFAEVIDAFLQKVNRHYIIRREAGVFDSPLITPLSEGTFFTWLQKTKKKVSAQTKVPRMSEEREIADALGIISGSFS